MLTHVAVNRFGETLRSEGVPRGPAHAAAHRIAEAVTGNADARQSTGDGRAAELAQESMQAIRSDSAEVNQWVFYSMAGALVVAFICVLWHPGRRVTGDAGGAACPEEPAPHPYLGPSTPRPDPWDLPSGPGSPGPGRSAREIFLDANIRLKEYWCS